MCQMKMSFSHLNERKYYFTIFITIEEKRSHVTNKINLGQYNKIRR